MNTNNNTNNINNNNNEINCDNEFDDICMIEALQKKGPSHINDLLLKYDNNSIIINTVLSFERLYVTDSDIFANNLRQYVDFIKQNNESLLFVKMFETMKRESLKTLLIDMFRIIRKSKKYGIYDTIDMIHKIIVPYNNNNKFKKLFETDTVMWDAIFGSAMEKIQHDDKWKSNISIISDAIMNFISFNKMYSNMFVKWVTFTSNICIKKINIDIDDYDNTLPTDYYIMNMLGVLFNFWERDITVAKLKKLKYDYVISDKSTIKWMDKKIINDETQYTFPNECLFLILNLIRVGYSPILYRSIKWTDMFDDLNRQLEEFNESRQFIPNFILRRLRKCKDITKEHIDMDKIIVNNVALRTYINDFYVILSFWILENKDKQFDDILFDMAYFMSYIPHMSRTSYKKVIYHFALTVVESKELSANICIRYDFLKLFDTVLINFIDKLRHAKCIETILTRLLNGLFHFLNDLNDSTVSQDMKLNYKMLVYKIIDCNFLNKKYEYIFINYIKCHTNDYLVKKMLNSMCMDLSDISGVLDEMYDAHDSLYNATINEVNDNFEEICEISRSIYVICNYYMLTVLLGNKLLKLIINNNFANFLLTKEIMDAIIMAINLSINKLSTQISYDENFSVLKLNTDNDIITSFIPTIKEYANALKDMLNNVYKLDINKRNFIESNLFNIKYFEEFNKYVDNGIENILDDLKTVIGENTAINEIDITNAPDEFVDQITYMLIETPCLLPGMVGVSDTDVYFDKYTIIKQLMIKEENPYTRAKLTMGEFEDFNNLPHIKEKNNNLLERLNAWKQQQ